MTPEQLKASILQYAIQGKLVEQRPEEGTAEDLYKSIQEERKNSSKLKGLTPITEEDILFDIPASWRWVKLGEIASVIRGLTFSKSSKTQIEGTSLVFRGGNIDSKTEKLNYDDNIYVDSNIIKDEQFLQKGDTLIVSSSGTKSSIGKSCFIDEELQNISFGGFMMVVRPSRRVNAKYISIQIKMYRQKIIAMTAGYIGNITNPILYNIMVPLPPLEEQQRIVAKIEELLPFVDRYAASYEKLEQFNAKFPEDMKKSILQYAIQGKLVEQRPEEGTAEELYKAIQEEKQKLIKEGKIKKEKPIAEITEDEIPFDIPDSWKWVKLGECINLLSGQDLTADRYNEKNEGTIYLTGASNLDDNENIIINRWTTSPTSVAHKGDLLLTCKGTIGKTAILTVDEAHIARQIMAITSIQSDTTFIKYFIKISVDMLQRKAKSMIPGIDRDTVRNLLLPLPPLEEQHRIVSKIEELLPYCDQLIK